MDGPDNTPGGMSEPDVTAKLEPIENRDRLASTVKTPPPAEVLAAFTKTRPKALSAAEFENLKTLALAGDDTAVAALVAALSKCVAEAGRPESLDIWQARLDLLEARHWDSSGFEKADRDRMALRQACARVSTRQLLEFDAILLDAVAAGADSATYDLMRRFGTDEILASPDYAPIAQGMLEQVATALHKRVMNRDFMAAVHLADGLRNGRFQPSDELATEYEYRYMALVHENNVDTSDLKYMRLGLNTAALMEYEDSHAGQLEDLQKRGRDFLARCCSQGL